MWMKCQQLNSLLSFGYWTAWVYLWCAYLSEDSVKINDANSCSLVDFCQFCNESIDFVNYLTISKSTSNGEGQWAILLMVDFLPVTCCITNVWLCMILYIRPKLWSLAKRSLWFLEIALILALIWLHALLQLHPILVLRYPSCQLK